MAAAWHVLGVGALGGLWASYLVKSGQKCRLILPAQEMLRSPPSLRILIDTPWDPSKTFQSEARVDDGAGPIAKLIITTKAYDASRAFSQVAHRLSRESVVVLIMNGLGVAEELMAGFPKSLHSSQLIMGTTTNAAYPIIPRQHIIHAASGNTAFGPYSCSNSDRNLVSPNSDKETQALRVVANELLGTELKGDWDAEVIRRLWKKVAVSACLNPLSALLECLLGELLDNPNAESMMKSVCNEVAAVAPFKNLPAEVLMEEVVKVTLKTVRHRSSMFQDVLARRKTEVAYINGFIARMGREHHIPTPINEFIARMVSLKEKQITSRYTEF